MLRDRNVPLSQGATVLVAGLTAAAALAAGATVVQDQSNDLLLQNSAAAIEIRIFDERASDIRLERGDRISFRQGNGETCSVRFDTESFHTDGEELRQTPQDIRLLDRPAPFCGREI